MRNIFIISGFLTIVWVVGLMLVPAWVEADSLKKSGHYSEIQNPDAMIVAQGEPDTSSENEKKDSPAENKKLDKENKESEAKPDKDFTPSIKIDADYAIAFPYDI